jgi:hypothetical protein
MKMRMRKKTRNKMMKKKVMKEMRIKKKMKKRMRKKEKEKMKKQKRKTSTRKRVEMMEGSLLTMTEIVAIKIQMRKEHPRSEEKGHVKPKRKSKLVECESGL